MKRVCVRCGRTMKPVKNGFHHVGPDGCIRSADLWGCLSCNRFQVHGIPSGSAPWRPIFGYVSGEKVPDPGNERFTAYLEPEFWFLDPFFKYMAEWELEFDLRLWAEGV